MFRTNQGRARRCRASAPAGVLALLVTASMPARAHAQGSAAAEALFEEGRQAMDAGDYARACARFAASDKLEPGAGVRANLALCYEKQGKVASAWASYKSALAKLGSGDDRAATIQARIDALAARLPHVVLVLGPGAAPGTTVTENGVQVGGSGLYDVSLPWDPGPHALTVQPPGGAPQVVAVTLAEGESRRIVVGGEVLPRALPAVAPPTPARVAIGPKPQAPPAVDAPATAKGPGVGPWVALGVGGVGLVIGVVAGALTLHDKSNADAGCSDVTRTCTPSGKSAAEAFHTVAPLTTVGLVLGAAGVAVGGIWFGVARSGQRQAGITVGPVLGGAAAALEGSW